MWWRKEIRRKPIGGTSILCEFLHVLSTRLKMDFMPPHRLISPEEARQTIPAPMDVTVCWNFNASALLGSLDDYSKVYIEPAVANFVRKIKDMADVAGGKYILEISFVDISLVPPLFILKGYHEEARQETYNNITLLSSSRFLDQGRMRQIVVSALVSVKLFVYHSWYPFAQTARVQP
jgi:hypothetical protein